MLDIRNNWQNFYIDPLDLEESQDSSFNGNYPFLPNKISEEQHKLPSIKAILKEN